MIVIKIFYQLRQSAMINSQCVTCSLKSYRIKIQAHLSLYTHFLEILFYFSCGAIFPQFHIYFLNYSYKDRHTFSVH